MAVPDRKNLGIRMEDGTFADPVESGTCNKIDEMTEIMACGPRAAENGILADPSDYQSWIVRSLRCIYYLLSKFFLEKKNTISVDVQHIEQRL